MRLRVDDGEAIRLLRLGAIRLIESRGDRAKAPVAKVASTSKEGKVISFGFAKSIRPSLDDRSKGGNAKRFN